MGTAERLTPYPVPRTWHALLALADREYARAGTAGGCLRASAESGTDHGTAPIQAAAIAGGDSVREFCQRRSWDVDRHCELG